LGEAVRQVLPPALTLRGSPSLHHDELEVVATYVGTLDAATEAAAQAAFLAKTGWTLRLRAQPVPASSQQR
jgi:hypothetical protein